MGQCQKDPTCGIFLKRGLFKDIKNDIPMCQTRKYKIYIHKYTNAQIQHMTKCQKDPTSDIFLKRGRFKDIKNQIPIQYKLEHLSFAQLYKVQSQIDGEVQGWAGMTFWTSGIGTGMSQPIPKFQAGLRMENCISNFWGRG